MGRVYVMLRGRVRHAASWVARVTAQIVDIVTTEHVCVSLDFEESHVRIESAATTVTPSLREELAI